MRNGAMSMFSTPPARITSASPKAISCAAETMACNPEPHILFRVMPGTSTGRPLFIPTWRPGFMPWPAERMLPTITWSTWSPSIPARERTSLPTVPPSSFPGVSLSKPPKVPIPVLRGVEMTISPIPLPLPKLTFSPSVYSRYRGYIKRQDPDHTARASLYTLERTALRLLVGPALHFVQVAPVIGEYGVRAVHVGVHRLLGRDGAVRDRLVGFLQRIGELITRFVYLSLLLLIHNHNSSFSVYIRTDRYPISGPRNIREMQKKGADPKVRPQSFDHIG